MIFVHIQGCVSLDGWGTLHMSDDTIFLDTTVTLTVTYPKLSIVGMWNALIW